MANTLADVRAGLAERFATLDVPHRMYVPTAPAMPAMLYTDPVQFSYARETSGQGIKHIWRIPHALIIPFQVPEGAAETLSGLLETVMAALDADPTLGNRLTRGGCYVREGLGEYVSVGGVDCLYYEFITEAVYATDAPRRPGL